MIQRWTPRLASIVLMLAVLACTNARAQALVLVADRNTPVPGGVISGVGDPSISGGNVAFHNFGSAAGINLFVGGVLTRVAGLTTPIPGGSGNFTGFGNPVVSGSNVAFLGFGSSGQQGIYLFNGSVLSRVADLSTPIPGGSGNFTEFDDPVLSGSNVAFFAKGSSGQQGIYFFNGSVLSRAADKNTAVPAGSGTFTAFDDPVISGSNVVFAGFGSSAGIYLFDGSVLSRVTDLSTPIPGGSGTFTGFADPVVSGGNVAFRGFGSSGQQGIYIVSGSVVSRVADLSTPIPGGSGTFTEFDDPVLSGSNVAFFAKGSSGQQGIYFFDGSVLSRVADLNTPIPGGTGNFTGFEDPVISEGNVAFEGFGAPNSAQEGIYLGSFAAPIPTLSEWAVLFMAVLLVALACTRLARQRRVVAG